MAWSLRSSQPRVQKENDLLRGTVPRPTVDKRTSSREDCFDE
ncbi:unnamed protein product [Ectocarpus sp. 13 AM-2016]